MSVALTSGKVPVKILTADDHPLLREALARLIAEIGSPVEMLEADSLRGAEDLLVAHRDLALIILDVVLPDATGIEAVDRVLRARPDVPLLVVSAKDDPATARAVLDSGARGFISKRSPTRVLAEAIRLVLVGETYLPPEVLGTAPPVEPDEGAPSGDPDAPNSTARTALGLTPRQFHVLTLLTQGPRNKLICRTLRLAERTVKAHTATIYRSLKVVNRTQAIYAASRLGIARPTATTMTEGASARDERKQSPDTTNELYRRALSTPMAAVSRLVAVLGRPAAHEGA